VSITAACAERGRKGRRRKKRSQIPRFLSTAASTLLSWVVKVTSYWPLQPPPLDGVFRMDRNDWKILCVFTSGSKCLSGYAARRVVVPLPHTLTPLLSLGRLWEAHQSPPVRYLQCCIHGLQSCSLEPKGYLILQSTLEGLLSHSSENKTRQKTCTHIHKTHTKFSSYLEPTGQIALNQAIYMLMWRAEAEIGVAGKAHYSKGRREGKEMNGLEAGGRCCLH